MKYQYLIPIIQRQTQSKLDSASLLKKGFNAPILPIFLLNFILATRCLLYQYIYIYIYIKSTIISIDHKAISFISDFFAQLKDLTKTPQTDSKIVIYLYKRDSTNNKKAVLINPSIGDNGTPQNQAYYKQSLNNRKLNKSQSLWFQSIYTSKENT